MTQRAVGIGCAKIILGGDYAVVYGQPAVASPIDRTVTVRIEGAEAWEIEVENEVAEKLVVSASLEQVCQQMSRAFGVETPFAVRIENAVPVGAGFGSSSAFNVAFARALAEWSGTGELVERVAEEAEEALHGYPSAIDLDASLRQGRFLYRGDEGDGAGPIESIAGPRLSLVAGWVGHGTPTERAYRDVETLRESEPELFERVVETSGEIAVEMSRAIEAGDHQRVGRMMDLEHAMLEALGVVGGEAARAVHLARRAGAYGAKTTGAGGDGAVLALVDGQSSVAEVWGAEGWNSFDVEI